MRRLPPEDSEARALRDRIEALQVELRQARKALEESRSRNDHHRVRLEDELVEAEAEISRWRERAETAERALKSLQEGLEAGVRSRSRERRADSGAYALVALTEVPDSAEELLPFLSTVSELSPYDLQLRLRASPPIPLVRVRTDDAPELCRSLRESGLRAVHCPVRPAPDRAVRVRRFRLEEDLFTVYADGKRAQSVPYTDLSLLVRARRLNVTREWKPERIFDGPRSKARPLELPEVRREEPEELLLMYAFPDHRMLVADRVDFRGLGARMSPSRTGCMQALAEELIERAPHAVVDDRLMKSPRYHLSGVEAAHSHEVLAELLWASLQLGG